MSSWTGRLVMVASGMGFPLTQVAVSRMGRRGAILAEGVAVGLLARDAALIAAGTPRRLSTGPARLLYAETAVATAAVVLGLPLLADRDPRARVRSPRPTRLETMRRVAVGTLFGLHSWRYRIYLSPSRGLRSAEPSVESSAASGRA